MSTMRSAGLVVARDVWTVDRAERQGRDWLRAPISERTGRHVPAPTAPRGCLPTGTSSEEADVKSASNTRVVNVPGLPEFPINDVTAGIDWARDDHAVCIVDGRGREVAPTMVEHTTAGLRDLVELLGPARRRRGRDRTPRRARRRHPAGCRPDRGGDQPEPGQEPARPLRLGRQQGRPVRRLRPGRHPAHRPRPAPPAGPRHRADRSRCVGPAVPARTWSSTASPRPTSSVPTCATSSPAPSACSPTSTPRSAWRS